MVSTSFLVTAVLAALAVALPTRPPTTTNKLSARAGAEPMAADVLATILELKAGQTNCADKSPKANCQSNVQAAQPLIDAFVKYNIYDVHEISAILATIAFESVNFQYDINVSANRAGQGTRNMQMANYNLKYAQSIPELKEPLAAITTATTVDGLDDTKMNAIRALVLPDQYSWASGAWFYSTQCSDTVKSALKKGGTEGWNAYLSCVGVTDTDGSRTRKWTLALKAFGRDS